MRSLVYETTIISIADHIGLRNLNGVSRNAAELEHVTLIEFSHILVFGHEIL